MRDGIHPGHGHEVKHTFCEECGRAVWWDVICKEGEVCEHIARKHGVVPRDADVTTPSAKADGF